MLYHEKIFDVKTFWPVEGHPVRLVKRHVDRNPIFDHQESYMIENIKRITLQKRIIKENSLHH